MRSIHQYLGLDDRHEVLFLAEHGISCERVRICSHARGTRQGVADMDNGPPFREESAHLAVGRYSIPKPIKPLCDALAWMACQGLRTGIDLYAGEDALVREHLGERCAAGALLADGLI